MNKNAFSGKLFAKVVGLATLLFFPLLFFFLNSNGFFYAQDEYYHFWLFNHNSWWETLIKPEGVHYFPLAQLLQLFQYSLFGLALYPRIFISLALHFIALVSAIKLLKTLSFYDKLFSPLLLILFVGLNMLNSQAYLWLSTYSGTIPCVIFLLWLVTFFFEYEKSNKEKYFWLSLLLLLISLLFKEYSLIGFPLLLFLVFLKSNNSIRVMLNKERFHTIIIILTGVLFMAGRTLIQFTGGEKSSQAIFTNKFNFFSFLDSVYAYFQITIKALWQISLPSAFIKDTFLKIGLPPGTDLDVGVFNLINNFLFIAGLLSLLLMLVFLYRHHELANKNFLFAIVFYLLSIVPFTILAPFGASSTFLEGKYYYLISFASLVLISGVVKSIFVKKISRLCLFIFMIMLICINGVYYYQMFTNASKIGQTRSSIINKITETVGKNLKPGDKNLIIYAYGAKGGYYALEDLTIPFQAGLGNMLALHLYDKKKFITKDYFKNQDTVKLFDTNTKTVHSWGTYEFSGKNFGFYFEYGDLKNYIDDNPDKIQNVFSFYWDRDKGTLSDITTQTRDRLSVGSKFYTLTKDMVIEHDINILGNKKAFAVNFDKQLNKYLVNEKEIVVHRDGLESTYGGPYLNFSFLGDGSKQYAFPKQLDGYELGFCTGVRVDGKVVANDIFFDGGKYKIIFAEPIEKGKTISIFFALNGKTIVYSLQQPMRYVLESKNISIVGTGAKNYQINLETPLKSLRSMYVNDIERYVGFGFVNGKMQRLKSWSGYNTNLLKIELFEPLEREQILIVPVLLLSDLTESDKIVFKYIQ